MIRQAVRLSPRDGYIVDSLGWVYYMQAQPFLAEGQRARGVALLEKAAEQLVLAIELTGGDPVVCSNIWVMSIGKWGARGKRCIVTRRPLNFSLKERISRSFRRRSMESKRVSGAKASFHRGPCHSETTRRAFPVSGLAGAACVSKSSRPRRASARKRPSSPASDGRAERPGTHANGTPGCGASFH